MMFHKSFQLNKKSFDSTQELISYGQGLSSEMGDFFKNWFNEQSFIVVKTSGSTGKPKEIHLEKKHMINSAVATGKYFDLYEKSKVLLCLPVNYIAGKMMLVRALLLGWHITYTKENSSPLKNITSTYDFTALVPLQLTNSINELHKIKKILVGGGVVPLNIKREINNSATNIYASYGMTETVSHIAIKKLNNLLDEKDSEAYKVLPNIDISTDSRGCLIIDAPLLSKEVVVTNDMVELISGNQFKWLGRFDSVINSGGVKLIPEQIEKKMASTISERFFVYGWPDEKLGERLILFIEKNGKTISNKSEVNLFLKKSNLGKYETPKAIYFIPKFKETETNKVHRSNTVKLLKYE
ncbi:AMP-binding protein [Bacteroidota bacterium]